MVDSREHPEILNILDIPAPPHGKASFINTMSVDYEKYPDVAKISKFNIALLAPGQK